MLSPAPTATTEPPQTTTYCCPLKVLNVGEDGDGVGEDGGDGEGVSEDEEDGDG